MNADFQTRINGTYREIYQEISFLSTIEPSIEFRPLVLLFVVDASHSMRFYIDDEKTIQRQTIVQKAISIALSNDAIIRDGDYIGLATFSTEAKVLLPNQIVEVTDQSRSELAKIVDVELKSDGGQTNYGKAFEMTLNMFGIVENLLGVDSPHLTGPVLVWFLTDGRPWPADIGNTENDIMQWAGRIGGTGNELWMIGISSDADHKFLEKIVLKSQSGASDYQKILEDVPKEFMEQASAARQTLWLDIAMETHEHLVYGLLNAIEYARINLGIVVELELIFASEKPEINLEFLSGVNRQIKDGPITQIFIKRPNPLKLGQKLSMAFSLKVDDVDDIDFLHHVRLQSFRFRFWRGSKLILETVQVKDCKLIYLINTDSSKLFGANIVRESLGNMRNSFQSHTNQLEKLLNKLEKLGISIDLTNYKERIIKLKEEQNQRKGLSIISGLEG
ncbi:MAG: vWA domain-containing protein [Candidatus Hodarchaeales archaeon]|jgi:Mg-chelatase subunit ChlD